MKIVVIRLKSESDLVSWKPVKGNNKKSRICKLSNRLERTHVKGTNDIRWA